MIIDKPKFSKATRDSIRKAKNNMKLAEADTSQLIVFDELIDESVEQVLKTKTVKRKKRNEDGTVVIDEATGNEVWELRTIEKIVRKKNVEDYNLFRKRKKQFVKQLRSK